MYQYFIFLLLISFLGTGAYYVNVTDDGKILSASFSSDPAEGHDAYDQEQVAGRYVCASSSGCEVPLELKLKISGDVSIVPYVAKSQSGITGTSSPADATDDNQIMEQGTWVLNEGGVITLTITEHNDEPYETPKVLVIQSVSPTLLSRVSYPQKDYPLMKKPKFIRIGS